MIDHIKHVIPTSPIFGVNHPNNTCIATGLERRAAANGELIPWPRGGEGESFAGVVVEAMGV